MLNVVFITLVCLIFVSDALNNSKYSIDDIDYIRHRRQTENNRCVLPSHPVHGSWELINGEAKPGDIAPLASVVIFKCNSGYKLSNNIPLVCLGDWSSQAPQCEELCPALYPSITYDLTCIDKMGKEVNCSEASHGTNLEYTCKAFYETPFGYKKTLFCENGKWDSPRPVCQPVCGKKISKDTKTLIFGSKPNNKMEHPWITAIYRKMGDSYEHICGGSILSQTVVLTAAHCVTNEIGNIQPKELYRLGVGKLYRSYGAAEDKRAQYLELSNIIVPEGYKANIRRFNADIAVLVIKGEMTLNEVVQPVCFTNMKNIHLYAGNKGEVSGWGHSEGYMPSEALRTLVIPYKYETICADELPPDWADRYNLKDKICAGFVNKSMGVCIGDSGGGLAFKYREDNRYYIHGIVSLAHKVDNKCNIQQNALYTSVAAYYDFVDRLLTKYAPKLKNCVLPPYPENGKWITDQPDLKPGDLVPSSVTLKVECDEGSKLSSTSIIECSEAHNMPTCDKMCPELKFPSGSTYNCMNNEGQNIDCSAATDGSTMHYWCPYPYTITANISNRTCVKGSWGSPTPECIRECGRKVVDNSGEGYEYPWHIGIYQKNNNTREKYKYICAGSLLSEYIILTAAQCMIDEQGLIPPKEDYAIAAGKLYKNYADSRDNHAQISNLRYIIVHPKYQGAKSPYQNIAILAASSPFILNAFVQPVCTSEFHEDWWKKGHTGMMVGWRSKEDIEHLEVLNIEDNGCETPLLFNPELFGWKSKSCVRFKDNSTCLLPEDYGKGIVAKNPNSGRYYLQSVAISYENMGCQKEFWSYKIEHYAKLIYFMITF